MALSLTVGGVAMSVLIQSITVDDTINATAQTTFTVVGTFLSVSQDMAVVVTDTVTGLDLYTGFVDSVDEVKYSQANYYSWVVTCKDTRWLYDKRYWIGPEFVGWSTGDIAAELHRMVTASEGVVASYASRHDNSSATLGAGTLTNCTASSGVLTLASAGSTFTDTDSTTATFGTGTLNTMLATGNSLQIQSYNAIKLTGNAVAQLGLTNSLYVKRKIWYGGYTLATADELYFDLWVSSTSPEIKFGVDLLFSDGTWYSAYTTDIQDQNGMLLTPSNDLKGWCDDKWYKRKFIVNATEVGKQVVACYLIISGSTAGTYTGYFKNIKITATGGGATHQDFFSGSDLFMNANVPASNNGYTGVACTVVTVHDLQGQRFTAAQSISTVGIVKGSVIDWVEVDTVQPTSNSSYPAQAIIDMSVDGGATYQSCVNHSALPLLAGMNTSGVSLIFRETLNIGGPNPELTPKFTRISYSVYSAAACTKTDFSDIDNTQTLLGQGVLTNCTSYSDGLKTTGSYKSWDTGDLTSQTLFGTSGPADGIFQQAMYLRGDANSQTLMRYDFASTWQNFIAEIDLAAATLAGGSEVGFVYRTTNWDNTNNSYAYAAQISATQIQLRKGTNTAGSNSTTLLAFSTIALDANTYYRMKIVVNGTSHQIFINDVPYITLTDSSYTAAGSVGVRWWNAAGAGRQSAYYDNFGIVAYESDFISVSTRVTPSLSLSGIVGDSRIFWTATLFSTSTLLVESTLDGGSTWQTCTNWQQIPLLVPGYNAAGKSVKFRFTMTNQAINTPLILTGYSAWIIGQYNATGTRISPVLALDNAGSQMGSSDVSWIDSVPTNTTVFVDSSPDNVTYTNIPNSGGAVAGLTVQGILSADDYVTNTAAHYTGTFWTGGVTPTFSVDTANTRLRVTAGTNAIVLWNTGSFASAVDVYLETILNQAGQGGLCWRYTSTSNLYYLLIADASSGTNPNTITVRKRVAGVDSLVSGPISIPTFIRATSYHTIKVMMIGTTITVLWDGVQMVSVIDSSLSAAGQVGFIQNSATESDYYSLGARQLGATGAGKSAYTRVRLGSTDPTVYPSVSDLMLSVRGVDLMTGATIPNTKYAYTKTCGQIMDDISKASGYSWKVEKTTKRVKLYDRQYNTAPWPLYSADPLFQGIYILPKVTRNSPLYRNRQYVTGAIAVSTVNESKHGDGQASSWAVAYPVDSVTSIIVDGDAQQVGLLGIDTGKDFYYTPGSVTISADASAPILAIDQNVAVVYQGRIPYTSMRESTSQQIALAAIDSTTGIVEASEDCGGLPSAAADALAQARIDQYAILTRIMEYGTLRSGLVAGMLQSVFLPEHSMSDVDMLVTEVKTNVQTNPDGSLWYQYDVFVAEGPPIGTWQHLFAQALLGP